MRLKFADWMPEPGLKSRKCDRAHVPSGGGREGCLLKQSVVGEWTRGKGVISPKMGGVFCFFYCKFIGRNRKLRNGLKFFLVGEIMNLLTGILLLPAILVLFVCMLMLSFRLSGEPYIAFAFLILSMVLWFRELILAWRNKQKGALAGLITSFILVGIMFFWFKVSVCDYLIDPIQKENPVITMLEQYKISHGTYPDSLDKLNINVDGYFYDYIGPDRYTLAFSVGFLFSKYHSASKQWSEVGSPKDDEDSESDLRYQRELVQGQNSIK